MAGAILTDPETRYLQGDLFVPSSGTRLFWSSKNTDGSAQKIAALDVSTRKFTWEQPSPAPRPASRRCCGEFFEYTDELVDHMAALRDQYPNYRDLAEVGYDYG
ncbi:hypothetical protein [Streptomyces sp. AP-93]|uniref:hypothetical protein n=1 Tax=Streptomyces sp. AP-93 TaxID=2929048 RepID=UPI001FB0160E|nr:hypothetical protein [Streptomyces sp. AP-93]MCJ0869686.1 hypothetical protein [Streptomyces sp. AP-93]